METNFLDELLLEVEQKEKSEQLAYYDLVLKEICELEEKIAQIFIQSDKETEIIKSWALTKASVSQERIDFLKRRLEAFIRESGQKTISLAHGELKIRKRPQKIEITDLDAFLTNASSDMLSIIPEQLKPDLNKIKSFVKRSGTTPKGVTLIEGEDYFIIKLSKEINDGNQN